MPSMYHSRRLRRPAGIVSLPFTKPCLISLATPHCSVNTPTKTSGVGAGKAADLTYWEGAARTIAAAAKSSKIIVEKSTVPVKTAEAIEKVCIRSASFVFFCWCWGNFCNLPKVHHRQSHWSMLSVTEHGYPSEHLLILPPTHFTGPAPQLQ